MFFFLLIRFMCNARLKYDYNYVNTFYFCLQKTLVTHTHSDQVPERTMGEQAKLASANRTLKSASSLLALWYSKLSCYLQRQLPI